jgi:small subunit ribosomal protein S1
MDGLSGPSLKPEHDELAAMLDEYAPAQPCRKGEIVDGTIVSVEPRCVLVDIGAKRDAIVSMREVEEMTQQQLKDLHPGQSVSVYVVDAGDKSDSLVVSLAKAKQQDDWEEAQRLLEANEVTDLKVVDANKGGVIVYLSHLRGFVPGSQLLPSRRPNNNATDPRHRWRDLVGQTLTLKVIEVTPHRNRLIFSEREARHPEADKRDILKSLEPDTVHKGVVSNLVDFGAFVNIKGVDGLLHISEISWQRINHPSEMLRMGQEVEVYILDIDLDRERLSLSRKRLEPDPWEEVDGAYTEGDLVDVEIVNITSFGAFACPLDRPGIEGLIHVSELSNENFNEPQDVVQVGLHKTARVISLRPDERRIAFSLKRVGEA